MAKLDLQAQLLHSSPRQDYRLIDSGDGRKLEGYGAYRFIRPEPQAMWKPAFDEAKWQADGEFIPASDEDGGGRWHLNTNVPDDGWPLQWEEVRFTARNTPFRHLGFFPDMDPVWRWLRGRLENGYNQHHEQQRALNLFGYTGLGTLAMAATGAEVVHVDASKKSVAAARENAEISGFEDLPIRWLIDDAVKFTAREVRRENRYDAILLDPPKYGRGPKGERWHLTEGLPELIAQCRQLLDEKSSALFLTVYAVRMSPLALAGLLNDAFHDLPGTISYGELAVTEEARGHYLPTAIFARWQND